MLRKMVGTEANRAVKSRCTCSEVTKHISVFLLIISGHI